MTSRLVATCDQTHVDHRTKRRRRADVVGSPCDNLKKTSSATRTYRNRRPHPTCRQFCPNKSGSTPSKSFQILDQLDSNEETWFNLVKYFPSEADLMSSIRAFRFNSRENRDQAAIELHCLKSRENTALFSRSVFGERHRCLPQQPMRHGTLESQTARNQFQPLQIPVVNVQISLVILIGPFDAGRVIPLMPQ